MNTRRLYFASRNHLLLAGRAQAVSLPRALVRGSAIAALNVAHALFTSPAPRIAGLAAVAAGVKDHLLGRYGPGR